MSMATYPCPSFRDVATNFRPLSVPGIWSHPRPELLQGDQQRNLHRRRMQEAGTRVPRLLASDVPW
jgi:hypothetical protein